MNLAAGARLGPYEIVSPAGVGGMGEVYRAKDTRLDRTVAVKVLPPHLAGSQELRQRFEREARAVSQLSHPHICPLYDVGNEQGVDYIVMEYLEGETLADRLSKGPLPPDQVVQYGIQMADALDRAHRQGIVHRDLKPGNVMLTKAGVKLLDFGLAKHLATSVEAEISQLTSMPTRGPHDHPLTEQGTIMGTFQYMSPEQLEGKEADARTDIFAFGTVLYEMATGRKAFAGKSRASMIAAILERDPEPLSTVAPSTPPALDRLIRTCLAKDPDDRFQTAHDLKLHLQWVTEGGSAVGLAPPAAISRRWSERIWMAVAAALLVVVAVLLFKTVGRPTEPQRMVQTSILPPEKVSFSLQAGPMALSPDGARIAIPASGAEGRRQLWIRPLSGLSAQALQGTEGATFPFWSPDSRYLAFFAGGKLKKIDASGGPPETICDAPAGRGGSWAANGTIVFSPDSTGPIFRVPAAGGAPIAVTKLDVAKKEQNHRFPFFLPNGSHFLYLARTPQTGSEAPGASNAVYVASLDTGESTVLFKADSQAIYAPPGYILFWREGTIIAQPFDARRRQLSGEPFPVAENVLRLSGWSFAYFSASSDGQIAYQGGAVAGQSQLAWYDRNGREIDKVGAPADLARPRLSHDEQRLAVDMRDPQSGNSDIWVYGFARKTLTRLTFDAAFDSNPNWSPDDRWIVFASGRKGTADIYRKNSSGTGAEELLFESPAQEIPFSWSDDGGSLLFELRDPARVATTGGEIWSYDFESRKSKPFIQAQFNHGEPAFSPDGRYVAYVSLESGRNEIYVQEFPGPGGKWQISAEGGEDPVWSRDGKEIFYVASATRLTAVPVKTSPTFEAGNPTFLFEARFKGERGQQYDVSADGQRFLVNADVAELSVSPVTLIQNWLTGKKR